ncbi:winged helix-turn-helix domain-containing protein [Deinococcus sonorensis]|uniref:Winged helix-turn-helix domain-containing protein n=2 Tax=Deinococcus sonorensis TaxID=309891 RepID=A0AAU7U6X6_9DEIO
MSPSDPPAVLESLPISDPGAARLLRQNHAFLSLFVHPKSPSEIAKRAGMAPNLAHHHARKLAEAGLLREVNREGGRVFFQVTAQAYRVPWSIMPPTDETGGTFAELNKLNITFRRAYERSVFRLNSNEEWTVGFTEFAEAHPPVPTTAALPMETHPTHFDALTLNLTAERYRTLVLDIMALMTAAVDDLQDGGQPCTIALLAYQGTLDEQNESTGRLARQTSSFLGWD